jgi:hypothetical protein
MKQPFVKEIGDYSWAIANLALVRVKLPVEILTFLNFTDKGLELPTVSSLKLIIWDNLGGTNGN